METKTYTYGDSSWADLLTKYNGKAITYDGIGNMTSYNGSSYTWMGRELRKITNGSNTYSYKYNADGIRTSKTVNGTTTEFFLNGSQILAQKTGDSVMRFFYDSTGKRVGFANGTMLFYYLYNVQGDVIAIVRAATGQVVAKYNYDAWGKCTVTNATGYAVGDKNPFRYRGYYYDTETGLYYLNSRYYNPEFGRFISADGLIDNRGATSQNLFAYCNNNPVNMADPTGHLPFFLVTGLIGAVAGAIIGGVRAAKSGNSVWKGALKGAAIGGAIGLGVGMAAGVVLAGSATASTGAVVAGAGTLASTISTGGLGAGASYIANNVSRAVGSLSPATQAAASKMQQVSARGKAGEAMSGLIKNNTHIPSLTQTASYRIPDGLDIDLKILSEVKNYSGILSYTRQLKDFVLWSQDQGFQMRLYTNATLSGPLQQLVDSGIIRLFPLG